MLGPPRFNPTPGDRVEGPTPAVSFVPREGTQDTPGASGSNAGPARLTPGPGASLPLDLTAEPTVAHIPVTTYTGHVVMYSSDRKITIRDRSDNIQKVSCPLFVLQHGSLPDECASAHFPRTSCDRE